jgi:hypothetical protein
MMKAVEMGNNIWHIKCVERAEARITYSNFPKCHTKILLGNFNAKLVREDIFKLIIRNKSLYEDSNDNGV